MNQNIQFNSTRRRILQSVIGGAAIVTTGWTSALLADNSKSFIATTKDDCSLPACDLSIYQLQSGTTESVTIMNQTADTVTIDEVYPVGLSKPSGTLIVKVAVPSGPVTLKSGERLTFSIEAKTGNTQWGLNNDDVLPSIVAGQVKVIPNVIAGKIRVRSNHPAFNGVIPVTVFDAVRV